MAKNSEGDAFLGRGKTGAALTGDDVLAALREHKAALVERFGVAGLALFGSFARGDAGADSDVDILVRFDGPATSKSYFGAQFYIEDLLGRPVDPVTDKAPRAEFRPYVEQEAIHVVCAPPPWKGGGREGG